MDTMTQSRPSRIGFPLILATLICTSSGVIGCGKKDGYATVPCSQSTTWQTGYDSGTVSSALPGVGTARSDPFGNLLDSFASSTGPSVSYDFGTTWTSLESYTYPRSEQLLRHGPE